VRDAIYSVGARNESRVLSLMSALPVNAGTPASPMRMLPRCSDPLNVPIERSQHADARQTAGQRNWIIEGARPGHLKASNEPGRVALVCRIVSLRALAAPIAFHFGAELVQRHRAEHRDPLAEHLERHPDRSLAALASDPRITLGLQLGDSSVVWHPRIKARSRRIGK
jgi:hypothetical protein